MIWCLGRKAVPRYQSRLQKSRQGLGSEVQGLEAPRKALKLSTGVCTGEGTRPSKVALAQLPATQARVMRPRPETLVLCSERACDAHLSGSGGKLASTSSRLETLRAEGPLVQDVLAGSGAEAGGSITENEDWDLGE